MRGLLDPKLPEESDEKDMLMAWTEFLRDPESEKVRSLEMSIEEIREAKDVSNDDKQRELYEMRSKILRDKVSALNEAERKGIEKGIKEGIEKGMKEGMKKGIEKGIEEGKLEIVKNLLDVLDDETISLKTVLTIEKIKELRKEN